MKLVMVTLKPDVIQIRAFMVNGELRRTVE